MTALETRLKQRIAATGPITLAEYMAECLGNPKLGYYSTRDPFGAAGDFTTAPEISQMFGELLGLCLARAWQERGSHRPFILTELGPGRGTCMADILRATRSVPGFHEALHLHLVETSPALRAVQKTKIPHALTHHDSVATLPTGPLYLVANEFLDALPIRQFQRLGNLWRERVVGLNGGNLTIGLADPMPPDFLSERMHDTLEGDIIETRPTGETLASELGQRIAKEGGIALIVDYGAWRSGGDTLQAVRQHTPVDPFATPGEADLTAHVDFEALSHAASPAQSSPLVSQGVLLERLGITARAQVLAQSLKGEALDTLIAAHRRLTHPEEMGTLFKVLALYQAGAPVPPGFNTA